MTRRGIKNALLNRPPSYVANVLNGLFLLVLGVWILMPWDSFGHRPAWKVATEIAPEYMWGLALVGVGVIKTWAAVKDDYRYEGRASFAGFLTWSIISISWWASDWQAPVCIVGSYLAIQAAHHYLMAR